jgi:hypothetical protein
MMSKRVIYKSAIDGRFVTKAYALTHPKTTIKQIRKIK